jgi:Protein of unknown function (DUF3570)
MKKLIIAIGLYAGMLTTTNAQRQSYPTYQKTAIHESNDSSYKARKLAIDEINFVSSYYTQEGNNSAVTGGVGTEKLTDIANNFDLKLLKVSKKGIKNSINISLGIDSYTSASSDNIDPRSITSASYSDVRIYPTLGWSMRDDKRGLTLGITGSLSSEYDYKSKGLALSFAKSSADNNREISLKVGAFLDTWKVILPYELRPAGYGTGSEKDRNPVDYKPRNSYSATVTLSQVINKRLQVALIIDPSYQEGLLSTPYHRVYLTSGTVALEKLPDTRLKLPIGLRANYFLGDRVVLRSFYRLYTDNWGLVAHTFNLETPVRLSPYITVSPFYRYHTQNAVKYFAPYMQSAVSSEFHTSDYDLAQLQSQFVGSGIRFTPRNGVMGMRAFNSLELRYGHYLRSTGLSSNIITLAAKFK